MFENCTKISTATMSRPEWLEMRKSGIGGSDAAAIIGISKYATPYTVYLDKIGILPEKEDNEALRQGRDLEEYVAQRFAEETGKKVQRCNYMIRNSAYPFALANIDRKVVGENAGLECKTTSTLDVKQFHGVEFPERYYAQCVHYMAVTGAERWYLAVLVFGREFHVYTLERDEAEIASLMRMEREFWGMVERQEPPELSGADADTEALSEIYSDSAPGEEVTLYGMDDLFSRLEIAEKTIATAKQTKEEIQNAIKERMGTAETAICGWYTVTWKTNERRTLDAVALKKAFPDIPWDNFMKVSKQRPFKVKAAETRPENGGNT